MHGLVQGVYFRHFTLQEARRLRVAGWVANQPDGSVRVVAEGDEAALRRLLDFLHHGPTGARVETVQSVWSAASGNFAEFRVRYL
ncbi:acylphosphatase [Promineifilum sp.]|uniref:acylphosphatase n=1 Tax=Promineifilum sp. TaxID=2664178 RepID=UPI0035B35DF2